MLTVRFSESESYDINTDSRRIMYIGTTTNGSFFAFGPSDKYRVKRRKEFKQTVVELMQEGLDPQEIEFELVL